MASTLAVLLLLINGSIVSAEECRLWLGPSHLGTENEPEFGMFAGVDFEANDIVPDVELAIPFIDWTEQYNRDTAMKNLVVEFVESQVWTGDFAGGAKWEGDHGTIVAIPGIGNLANYHSGTHNVDWQQSAALLRKKLDVFESGVAHPARGAITPYYNLTMKATQKIPAGMELFANFGETWDSNTSLDDSYQDKLTRWDYQHADQVLDAIVNFMETHEQDISLDLKYKILDFMLEKILCAAVGKRAKTIRSLIPATPKKLKAVQDAGGTFMYRNDDLVKSPKWLKKHAICSDNLRGDRSTNPEAGRGAFATRKISKGKIVAPSPMMHFSAEDLFTMYETKEKANGSGDATWEYDKSKPLQEQLAINYMFGHRESSILLFPIGSHVTLINHAPAGKANAYITWSRHKHVPNDHSLHDLTIDQLAERNKVGIVMVVQALRDIEEGEEVFIDYGPEWEAAWMEHMNRWTREFGKDKTWELRADDMKATYREMPFATDLKDGINPYPPSVATTCFLKTDELPDGNPRRNDDGIEIFNFAAELKPEKFTGADMYVCDVLSRSEKLTDGNLYNYTVLAKISDDDIVQVENVPHNAITFVDQPYQSDIHAPGVFRHYISIRDSDFPQAWRNLRE